MKNQILGAAFATLALTIGAGVIVQAPAARADAASSYEAETLALASYVETATDDILVRGDGVILGHRSTQKTDRILSEYIEQVSAEAQALEIAGGVTVTDTTAKIVNEDGSTPVQDGPAYLHVTREVAELPSGELWEEMIPIELQTAPDGEVQIINMSF